MQFNGQLFASPNYLKQFGNPQHPNDLVHHECLGFQSNVMWELNRHKEKVNVNIGARFMLNNIGMTRKLAILAQGILFIPLVVVKDDIDKGLLIPVLPEWKGNNLPVYALTETRLLPAKTRVFIDFLQKRLMDV